MPELVLVGAGHTHVQVLKRAAMQPFDARITLVVDRPVAVYSGMVPGLVAGQYAAHELEIDAVPLARRAGARVVFSPAVRVDAAAKQVHFEDRPPIGYDVASLNIGSTVAGTDLPGVREHAVPTRPIRRLLDELNARVDALGERPRISIVGAGAGGVELAFTLQARLQNSGRDPTITLVFRSARPLPGAHERVVGRLEKIARERGIVLAAEMEVTRVTATSVETRNGSIPTDLTLWVTGAVGHDLATASGLPVDPRGFVWVDDDLRVTGHPSLFAAGDCAVLRSWPGIPKAGVYAVRQGPVLDHNLRAHLEGGRLRDYRAQRDFFSILNLGDGTALGTKWGQAAANKLMMVHKDRIDRAFMERFQVLAPDRSPTPAFAAPMGMDGEMVCGGCAAKVAQAPLARALGRLPPLAHPSIALGPAHADDVVAWRSGDTLVVQNIDAFSAFTDDPFVVGQVAANNATSDLYAKGIQPDFAMATVQIPEDADQEETLYQVMAGLRHTLDADRIPLLGGHTTLGEKLVVGLVVTANVPALPWRNAGAQPSDALVLTRALGTGALFHADMAGRAAGDDVQHALKGMVHGNRRASEAVRGLDIHAATDVTGFGLAGHLAEMLRASACGATLTLADLPLLPGVEDLLAHGERSTFHDQNHRIATSIRVRDQASRLPRYHALFDPQTAGGLLFATPDPEAVLTALHAAGEEATIIGHCTPASPDGALFEVRP